MATRSLSLYPTTLTLTSISKPKSLQFLKFNTSSNQFTSTPSLPTIITFPKTHRTAQKSTQIWRIAAISEDLNASEQIVVTNSDDGVYNIISVLLFVAFVGLTILTIGVVYIAVTDFLQKRERDKFEKEEAAKKKKGGKKGNVRVRTGPKGFGQKIDEDDAFDL